MVEEPTAPVAVADDPLEVAQRFAHELALQEERDRTSVRLAAVWAPAVTLMVVAFFGLFALICYQVTTEHAAEHQHQVRVWCYADPNADGATSEFVGSPVDVRGICPDAR